MDLRDILNWWFQTEMIFNWKQQSQRWFQSKACPKQNPIRNFSIDDFIYIRNIFWADEIKNPFRWNHQQQYSRAGGKLTTVKMGGSAWRQMKTAVRRGAVGQQSDCSGQSHFAPVLLSCACAAAEDMKKELVGCTYRLLI